jgi:hypothetical protein
MQNDSFVQYQDSPLAGCTQLDGLSLYVTFGRNFLCKWMHPWDGKSPSGHLTNRMEYAKQVHHNFFEDSALYNHNLSNKVSNRTLEIKGLAAAMEGSRLDAVSFVTT